MNLGFLPISQTVYDTKLNEIWVRHEKNDIIYERQWNENK